MTVWTIGKEWTFDAAHSLPQLPADHKCHRLHGHTYTVGVAVEAYFIRDDGMIFDYALLDPVKRWIDSTLDHRNLNDVVPADEGPTTAENLARWMWDIIRSTLRSTLLDEWATDEEDPVIALAQMHLTVTVRETPKTFASYRGGTL